MTMILDLPRDMLMEIFGRLPLKSMREVQLTCKTLNILSQSESFAEMQLAKEVASREEGEHQRIVILDDKLSLMRVVVDGDPSTEPKVKLIGLNQKWNISYVSHCEGLLLCVFEDLDRRIVVWNPYWGQTRWIEPRHIEPLSDIYVYSLGYANKGNTCRRRHKLLRFVDDRFQVRGEHFQWYEIYDFDSDQWTTLDDPQGWHIDGYQRGVSLKGNTYFCATKANSGRERNGHLICFYYKRESFGPLMRMPFSSDGHDHVTLSCVKEEQLAVLQNSDPYKLDVWITTKIRPRKVLWSKLLTLSTGPHKSIESSGFFIDEGKKVVMRLDRYNYLDGYIKLSIFGEAGYFKRLQLVKRSYTNTLKGRQMCSYVPSLVKLKQPTRGPSKQQSDWEQHRYDQKMSRLVEYAGAVKRQKT